MQRELLELGPAAFAVTIGAEAGSSIVGSKAAAGVVERIVSLMPKHRIYLEIFAGRAAVARKKLTSPLTLLIDRDPLRISYLRKAMPGASVVLGDCRRVLDPDRVPSDALLYADPPYLKEVRSGGDRRYYDHDMLERLEHVRLIKWLKTFTCPVMLSGYRCELYDRELTGWHREDIPTMTRQGPAVESVWCSFDPRAVALHDTRFFGENFRERERIKRKAERWVRRFEHLPAGERMAILDRLASAGLIRSREA
jgi:DNA adenine methylase